MGEVGCGQASQTPILLGATQYRAKAVGLMQDTTIMYHRRSAPDTSKTHYIRKVEPTSTAKAAPK
jgi:hypothetical protein